MGPPQGMSSGPVLALSYFCKFLHSASTDLMGLCPACFIRGGLPRDRNWPPGHSRSSLSATLPCGWVGMVCLLAGPVESKEALGWVSAQVGQRDSPHGIT